MATTAATRRGAYRRCSICGAAFRDEGVADLSHAGAMPSSPTRRGGVMTQPRIGGLDASFVNIPHSRYFPSDGGNGDLQRNVDDIESILGDALGDGSNLGRREFVNGADMQEASLRMDAHLEAAMAMLSRTEDSVEGEEAANENLYCGPCIDRIGTAIETCSERLEKECISYDRAAAEEEERTSLLAKVVSMNSDTSGLGSDDIHGDDDEDAIHRAIDSFQYELDTIQHACDEQENELRTLQNLMQGQVDRSNAIADQEDMVFQQLNALEIDARNFGEESHLVSNSCSAVENEIEAMSRVKIMSLPFDIKVDWDGNGQKAGKYPTINSLRLAYRINENAGLHREEINAAFTNAAQLVAFTLGLYPSLITSTIRIIPIRPCAKILVHLPEGQSVHNLGFDTTSGTDHSNHVPSQSITLLLVILSELAAHILTKTDQSGTGLSEPPFDMTEFSIDNVDVTKLAESNTAAWSSVVFCMAANLRWLSEQNVASV